jgi:hypothetical protein
MAIESIETGNKPIFCFVHGRYHDGWCWHLTQEELANAGWSSIAPTLSTGNPELSFNDHALIVSQAIAENGAKETILVPHSWAANIAPRVSKLLGANAVKQQIFVAPSFHTATFEHPTTHSMMYEIWKQYEKTSGFDIDALREFASYVFYHDVEDEGLKAAALSKLRPHPRREIEPQLERFPDIRMEYVLTNNDRVLQRGDQAKTARALGVKPTYFESGHAPMLSQPKKLAEVLIKLANTN